MPKQVLESAERTLAALEGEISPLPAVGRNDNVTSNSSSVTASSDSVIPSSDSVTASLSRNPKKNTVKPYNIKEGRVESDGSLQLSFFQLEDPLLSSLKDQLDSADLNNMTPLQAFDLLRSMKEQLGI